MRAVVLGAGGHAKVVVATLQACGFEVAAVFDDDPSRSGDSVLGVRVEGPTDRAREVEGALAVIAVGHNEARGALARRHPSLRWLTAAHPRAFVHPSVSIGPGTVVCAGAIIQPDTRIGAHVIVNTGARIDHDCVVEDLAHVAPGASIAGGVSIGEGTLVGIGSCVIPGVSIGPWTTVGAGAAVVGDTPGGRTLIGVPARPRLE